MKGSGERCFVACTVDLLATGVDIERLNAVVFFRYLESSILFYQMVGRGTRIHEATQKYKFWLYDYTGVTDLFGTDFITAPARPRLKRPEDDGGGGNDDGGGGGGGPDRAPLPEMRTTSDGTVVLQGRYILQQKLVEGVRREVMVPVEDYRQQMVARVLREAATLQDFRGLWVQAQKRRQLMDHLLGEQFSPNAVREMAGLEECDHFDLFAHYGYQERALKRHQRTAAYLREQAPWFEAAGEKAGAVLRGVGHQFGLGGTEALESEYLWAVSEIRRAGGLSALRPLGPPAEVLREAKLRLFGV
jgi:type I restriction enzyme R subunit